MDTVVPTIISGVVVGSLYALMASGLSVVWTTLGVFNFAHGAIMMAGAYIAWSVSEKFGLGAVAGLIAGTAGAGLIGVTIERLVVRPYYNNPNMLQITAMTTLACTIILERGAQMIWGPRIKQLPHLIPGEVDILGTVISAHECLLIVLARLSHRVV